MDHKHTRLAPIWLPALRSVKCSETRLIRRFLKDSSSRAAELQALRGRSARVSEIHRKNRYMYAAWSHSSLLP